MFKSAPTVILSFLLGAVFSFGAAEATSHYRQLDRLLEEVHEDIDDVQALLPTVPSHSRRALARELVDLEGSALELQAAIDSIHGPAVPVAVSPEEFSRIRRAVAAESFADDQLAVLRSASQGRRFTTAQVSAVMELFSFSDDKVDAAAMLYPQVVDPHNWYTVYDALTFSSDKDMLRKRTR